MLDPEVMLRKSSSLSSSSFPLTLFLSPPLPSVCFSFLFLFPSFPFSLSPFSTFLCFV